MDGDSVRSGRSEHSNCSHRAKRVQRLNNAASFQNSYAYQNQLKNNLSASNANVSTQPLLHDQNIQFSDANTNYLVSNQMFSNLQQNQLNTFSPQHINYSQQYQINQQLCNTESWIPSNLLPNVPPNTNYSICSQHNTYGLHHQGWVGQQIPQTYTQFVSHPINNQFVRVPMNATLNKATQPQMVQVQQPTDLFAVSNQNFLHNSSAKNVSNSRFLNCQAPSEQATQFSNLMKPERLDNVNDENAWVEEVTAVTGATSETGLSGGDNFSRFGARYDLAKSLGLHGTSNGGFGLSGAATALIRSEVDNIEFFKCSHIISMLISMFLGISSLLSPILMLIFPLFPYSIGWSTNTCESDCEGYLISISVKLLLLGIALWFWGIPYRLFCDTNGPAIFPRIRLYRTLFLCLVMIILFAFWLFYAVRIIQPKESNYFSVVLYASGLSDTMLFLYYAGIALMEFRRVRCQFAVHVLRSPDGASKTFKCGDMSLQRAALEVLQFYMVEFAVFNANQQSSLGNPVKRNHRTGSTVAGSNSIVNGGVSKYKFYDVDGTNANLNKGQENEITYTVDQTTATAPSASSRLYEEIELDKRIRKRRMRLLLAVEEAFSHVKHLTNKNGGVVTDCNQITVPLENSRVNGRLSKLDSSSGKLLDPYEAAQAIFPTLVRPLQKYMRATRQQARHPVDMVIYHLALCLAYGLSPLAFLERFNLLVSTPHHDVAAAASAIECAKKAKKHFKQQENLHSSRKDADLLKGLIPKHTFPGGQQAWSILADRALTRSLVDGVVFQLRRNDVSLLCTVRRLPFICLIEETFQPMEVGRFTLRTDNTV